MGVQKYWLNGGSPFSGVTPEDGENRKHGHGEQDSDWSEHHAAYQHGDEHI
jgi:hypothetical protein